VNDDPRLDQDSDEHADGLARLPGLEAVRDQLAARIAVLQAEQATTGPVPVAVRSLPVGFPEPPPEAPPDYDGPDLVRRGDASSEAMMAQAAPRRMATSARLNMDG
jgi:hypothetical protein